MTNQPNRFRFRMRNKVNGAISQNAFTLHEITTGLAEEWDFGEDGGLPVRDILTGDYDVEYIHSTGLADKNGKEIFEGDIVTDSEDRLNRGQVIWDGYQWNVEDFYAPSYDIPGDAFSEKMIFEVIGNIHENPELLTPDKND